MRWAGGRSEEVGGRLFGEDWERERGRGRSSLGKNSKGLSPIVSVDGPSVLRLRTAVEGATDCF